MNPEPTPRVRQQPQTIDQWRAKATSAALLAVAAVDLPLTAAAFWFLPDLAERMFFAGSCAVVVVLAIWRRPGAMVRAGCMDVLAYVTAVMMLARAGLVGSGRLVLFAVPLYTLVLMGRRYAALALVTSVAILGAFAALAGAGWAPMAQDVGPVATWLYQGLALSLLAVPLFLLIDRASEFQIRTLAHERALARDLEDEIANRRALERRLLDVGEGERNAVGQELHDGVCQQLSAAYLGARLLERDLSGPGTPAGAQAARLADLLDAAQHDARLLARGLNPGQLAAGGLPDALHELARQVRDRVEVDCDVVCDDAPSLPPQAAIHLLRIAQEATTNAIRHAGPTRITITLSEDESGIRLAVRDDGCGISPDATPGLGLRSMANRAQGLGGSLAVTGQSGGGTEVLCTLPRPELGGKS